MKSQKLYWHMILNELYLYYRTLIISFKKQQKGSKSQSKLKIAMEKLKQIMAKLDGIDPYDMLQSKPSEDFLSLKKNYRSLALKYHPDRNKQQSAKEKFIQINLAYEFLEQQENRQIYQNHLKALEQQKLRQQKMTDDRKKLLDDLKRREEQFNQRRKDMNEELKRKKQFFQKKMKEQEEREQLRQQILTEMKPHQYYEELTSIKVQWQKGLSFSKFLLEKAFSQYGKVTNVKVEPKSRQAIVSFSSIQNCGQVVKKFDNPQIKIDFMIESSKREQFMKALKKQKSNKEIDFSLTTQNLSRLKQVMNRNSSLYLDPSRIQQQ